MAETIKATGITEVRIEDELGEGVVVHRMVRTYVMPGLYILNRHKHGPSPTDRTWVTISNHRSKWVVCMPFDDLPLGESDTLSEAVQIALLELHR